MECQAGFINNKATVSEPENGLGFAVTKQVTDGGLGPAGFLVATRTHFDNG